MTSVSMESLPQTSKQDLFKTLIDLVSQFQAFCENNGLKCFAIGGTLLKRPV